jgi:hypothetical protein
VVVQAPEVIGTIEMTDALKLMALARGALEDCRSDRAVTVSIQLLTHCPGIAIAQPNPNRPVVDKQAAQCAATRFKAAAEAWTCKGSGIISVEVTLPAR